MKINGGRGCWVDNSTAGYDYFKFVLYINRGTEPHGILKKEL